MDKFMQRCKGNRLFFRVGILSAGILGLFLLSLAYQSAGMSALACCYDPPAPTITPDAPSASPEPAEPVSDTPSPTNAAAAETDGDEMSDDENLPVISLADLLLQPARKAIASGEWLKAQIIVDAAEEKLGNEPELERIKAEINTHFGLAAPQVSPLITPKPFMTGRVQSLAPSSDPLKAALSDLGAVRTLP